MSKYQVTLLGIPSVVYQNKPVHFPYRKAEGIFYYLCIEKNVNRDKLISIFWGSNNETSGRKNLRQALFQIRRCLGDDIIILHGKQNLSLNPKYGIKTEWDASDEDFALSPKPFLDFFYLKECSEFEDWVQDKRNIQISRSLNYIKTELKDSSVYRDISRLRRLIETWSYWKPWDEDMVLAGMKCYAHAEKYDLGIQLHREYVNCLQRELDEQPSHSVELLFRTLFHRKEVSLKRKADRKDHFFGRLAELQYIDERVFWFLHNDPCTSIIIKGEVGVGKTALMEQILEMNRNTGILELVSHCYGAEDQVPLRAWRDLFKQLEDLQNDEKIHLSENSKKVIPCMLTGIATENQNPLGNQNKEYLSYTALEDSVLSLFKELAVHWKIILYFDSLQWMDVLSQQLLQRIMIELGNREVFMIATCRIDEKQAVRGLLAALTERYIVTTLQLACFSEPETELIIKEVLPSSLNDTINTHEIFLRTEGNPLVLMDTLNMIQQEGWKDNYSLPRIDMLIQLWLERLTSDQRKVLDALSIHMVHADLEDLELLVEIDRMELFEVLEQLLLTRFVTEQTLRENIIYKFRHQFYKDYVYQHLSLGKRRMWHHTIAEFYEKKKDGERWRILLPFTIKHYECSGDYKKANYLRNLQNTV